MLIGSMKTKPFKPTHLNIFDLNEFDENQPNQGVTMLSNVRAYFCCRRTISFYIALRWMRESDREKKKEEERKKNRAFSERKKWERCLGKILENEF
jgi:hypothetical protein